MAFRGWKAEALEFFEELEADNSKAFWQRNKQTYETLVRAPMEQLLEELAPRWGEGRIFRPYRDVRFSSDKSPYKTHIGAMVGDGYVQLDARGLGAGCGMWEMTPDQLERYREAVDADATGRKLEALVAVVRKAKIEVTGHEVLKTAPKGYPKDHPRIELLRYKGLITWREWPAGAWLGTGKAKDRLVGFLEASEPLNAWLRERRSLDDARAAPLGASLTRRSASGLAPDRPSVGPCLRCVARSSSFCSPRSSWPRSGGRASRLSSPTCRIATG